MSAIVVRHCIVQRPIHYYLSRYNAGQWDYRPGDAIFVRKEDYPRLARQGKVIAVDEVYEERMAEAFELADAFPRRGRRIWVFGDGPTGTAARGLIEPEDVVFAVNRCDLAPLSLVPDYYVALDDFFFDAHVDRVAALPALRKFTKRGNVCASKLDWPELRFFDVRGEEGFSLDFLEVYHGKTSCYPALQLACQCAGEQLSECEIHIAGLDLAVMTRGSETITHHYGAGAYQEPLFGRMLTAIRYGLRYLNELGVRWVSHSPLLRSRIADLEEERDKRWQP